MLIRPYTATHRFLPDHYATRSILYPLHLGHISLSTTAAGTSYEHLVALTLRRLAFSLTHVGGRSDRGIDLLGHWYPPTSPRTLYHANINKDNAEESLARLRIPLIVQCKAYTSTPKPAWVRELQGAVSAAPLHLGEDVVGVLVSKGKVTGGVREAVMKAEKGVVWVQVEEMEGCRGKIGQLLWNRKVTERVGEGLGTGFVYTTANDGLMERDLRLLVDGKVWEDDSEAEEQQ